MPDAFEPLLQDACVVRNRTNYEEDSRENYIVRYNVLVYENEFNLNDLSFAVLAIYIYSLLNILGIHSNR